MGMVCKITDTKTFYGFLKDLIFNSKEIKQTGQFIETAFKEKVILAVTQVNGCRLCSYVHSKNALKSGVGEEEIQMLLSGDFGQLSREEAEAILFAQHYADSRGDFDPDAYQKMEDHLGAEKAKAVLGTIRVIMVANTHGIALDLIKMRFSGKKDPSSRFVDEIGIALGMFLMVPSLFVQKLFR